MAGAGGLAPIAVAKPPPGHGHHQDSTVSTTGTTSTTATTTTTSGHGHGHGTKVLVCHKVGDGHYVLVRVSANSALAKGKHGGDVLASSRTCPGPIQGPAVRLREAGPRATLNRTLPATAVRPRLP